MEETKLVIKSRNITDNISNTNQNSSVNQIKSTKIVPHFPLTKYKLEGMLDDSKESTNLKSINPPQITNRNERKISLLHSKTIKPPTSMKAVLKDKPKEISINTNNEEVKKTNEISNNNNLTQRKKDFNYSNKVINNFSSLMKSSMTPNYKSGIKRLNSINVNILNRSALKNNLNNLKFNPNEQERLSLNLNKNKKIKNYNFKEPIRRRNTTYRESIDSDKTSLYLRTLYAKKFKKKPIKITNPLQIPDEDKIFNEMKKYLCYKYEKRRISTSNNKGVNDEKKFFKTKSDSKIKKIKNELKTSDKIRLNYLYLSTNKVNNKIYKIQRKKLDNDLITYQKNLLDVIKPSISDYTYMYLKDRLFDIRKKDEKRYQNNYRKIIEIESEEKEIISQFNEACERCEQQFKKVKEEKEILNSVNLDIKLPPMTFVSCLKKNKIDKNNDKFQKKLIRMKIKYLKKNK